MATRNLGVGIKVNEAQVKAELDKLQKMITSAIGNMPGGFNAVTQAIQKQKDEMSRLTDQVGKMTDAIEKHITSQEKMQKGMGRSLMDILHLRQGISGYIKDVETMIAIQARWYAARAILGVPVAALKTGVTAIADIDQARGTLLRYSALEQEIGAAQRRITEDLVTHARTLAVNLPVSLDNIVKAADRLRAAGLDIDTVRASLESFVKVAVAFPEIEQERFTTAIVGFLNTFRNTPGLREMENDAERIKAILEKVTKALAIGVIAPKDVGVLIQHLGQMSQAAGFSIDQMMALSVMITNLGVKAGPAGRAMRGLIDSFSTPKGMEALESINVRLDKTKTIAEQLPTIIKGLREAVGTGGAGMTLGAMEFLREIAPTERRSVLIALIRELEQYDKYTKSIANSHGALDRTSSVMTNTLKGLWEILKNVTKEILAMGTSSELLNYGLQGLILSLKVVGTVMGGWIGILTTVWDLLKQVIAPFQELSFGAGAAFQTLMETKSPTAFFKTLGASMYDAGKAVLDIDLEKSLNKGSESINRIMKILWGGTNVKAPAQAPGIADFLKNFLGGGDSGRQYVNEHNSRLIALEKQMLRDQLSILKSGYSLQNAVLDDHYKRGYLQAHEYYAQKLALTEAELKAEIDAETKGYQQIQDEIDAKYAHDIAAVEDKYRNEKNREELQAKEVSALWKVWDKEREGAKSAHEARMTQIETKGEADRLKENRTAYEKQIQLANEYYRHLETMGGIKARDLSDQELAMFDRQAKNSQWLYDRRYISAKWYYSNEVLNAQYVEKVKNKLAEDEYVNWLMGQSAKIMAMEGHYEEEQKFDRENTERLAENESRRLANHREYLAKRIDLDLQARDDIQDIWEQTGAAGVVAHTAGALSRDYGNVARNIESATTSMAQTMTSALGNFLDVTSDRFMKWGDLVTGIIQDITNELIRSAIIRPFVGMVMVSSYFSPNQAVPGVEGGVPKTASYVPGRASGGPVSAGDMYWVGERGPELFVPGNSGSIVPGGMTVNIQMNNTTGLPLKLKQTGQRVDEKTKVRTIIMDLSMHDLEFQRFLKGMVQNG